MFRKEDSAALDSVMASAPAEEPMMEDEMETEEVPEAAPEDPAMVLDTIESQLAKLRAMFPSSAA